MLIILLVAWALLGYSSALGGTGCGHSLAGIRLHGSIEMANSCGRGVVLHVIRKPVGPVDGGPQLSSTWASPHGLSFSQHRGCAPRGEDVNGRFLKAQPQKLRGVIFVTLLCSK